ncbi:MAG: UDP-N-acetylmuramoyl-tripeptide--D-alanyl-D-alanine ligase [Desulfobacterales bacterium]|jgi:UDP-N-acetylmuramoyl-tripeptide--D-alanyl-D-alanine ligase
MGTPWTVGDILEATGGRLISGVPDLAIEDFSIDSRRIGPADAFVAIIGETHDGHRFLPEVIAAGVRCVVVAEDRTALLPTADDRSMDVSVVAVADTTMALGDLAAYHRRRIGIPVVALTGSNGKTTTRAMTQEVLSTRFSVMATIGNFNNPIGLPLTLLRLKKSHDVAVVELGMNHPGEIDTLGAMADPDVGIITNIAPAHLEGLGSVDGVRDAKGELLARIRKDGTALLNADDPKVQELVPRSPVRTRLYGTSPAATIRAEEITDTPNGVSFRLVTPEASKTVQLAVHGRFMVSNALAAAAAGHTMGLSATQICIGLERFRPVKGRMDIKQVGSIHVIDDTYNANPASMTAALDTLTTLRGSRRGIAVLGEMLELGAASAALHREIGERAARSGISRLFVAGDHAKDMVEGAIEGGLAADQTVTGEVENLIDGLREQTAAGDWILVKGSRGMRMERIVMALVDAFSGTGTP